MKNKFAFLIIIAFWFNVCNSFAQTTELECTNSIKLKLDSIFTNEFNYTVQPSNKDCKVIWIRLEIDSTGKVCSSKIMKSCDLDIVKQNTLIKFFLNGSFYCLYDGYKLLFSNDLVVVDFPYKPKS